ncbi:MAG: hypothetical protein PHD31_02695 [Candidatus Pacebacteria bacterium]|nr:hypothetical protein [Candidatus Paceibacterota bacterium]
MNNLILVSNWEKVDKNDFYLSDKWNKKMGGVKEAKELQKNNDLFVAYIVEAKNYTLFSQMDASQVFINKDGDVILHCESAVIDDKHDFKTEYKV